MSPAVYLHNATVSLACAAEPELFCSCENVGEVGEGGIPPPFIRVAIASGGSSMEIWTCWFPDVERM